MAQPKETSKVSELPECFVIMPMTDPDGYTPLHFKHVYEDIISPACTRAGFISITAGQVKESNLIHLDILQKLINTPMALCDLSSRNPNVMFELALRQAFDKPVTLIQEIGTLSIFDIAPFRYTEYRKERIYHEVIEDQEKIASTIKETFDAYNSGRGINSIVKLLALSKPATIPEIRSSDESPDLLRIVLAEVSELRNEIRSSRQDYYISSKRASTPSVLVELDNWKTELMDIESKIDKITSQKDFQDVISQIRHAKTRVLELEDTKPRFIDSENDLVLYRKLMDYLSFLDKKVQNKKELIYVKKSK